jgi:S1-C subfamily serine protease
LDAIIKQLEVTDLKKSYDPDGYQLSYMFVTSVPPADLDTVLWAEIAKDEALSAIAQDATSGSTLGYFYLQERPVTKPVSIVLKNLGPEVYNKIGRRFISAIKVVPGVDRLQREYSEDDQTLRLEFRYQGESIYTIDDAVWESAKRDKALASLVMAGVTDDQLVYVLGGKDADRHEVVIHMRKVSGADYKIIATEFKSLLSHLKNVRDVSYHYDFPKRTVVFKLRFEGPNLYDLEDAIQRALVKPRNKLFQHVSKGADTAGRMVYLYSAGDQQQKSETDNSDKKDAQQGSQTQQASSSQLADLVERLDATVVWIGNSEGGRGSGFFVTPDGYLLTNDHVVRNNGDLFVRTLDRDYLRVNIVKTDEELDLALLRVVNPQRTFKSVDIGNSRQLRKGQSVLNIGNPLDEEYEHSVTPGHIAGLNRHKGLIQLSLPTFSGQSGSPVFDMNGRVIGVIVSGATRIEGVDIYTKVKDDDNSSQQTGSDKTTYEKQKVGIKYSADTIGFAIPIDYARGLLELARP